MDALLQIRLETLQELKTQELTESVLTDIQDVVDELRLYVRTMPKSDLKAQLKQEIEKAERFILLSKTHKSSNQSVKSKSNQTAQSSLQLLQNANSQLMECKHTGQEILGNLQRQRETIQSTQNKLTTINRDLSISRKWIHRMQSWWRR